MMDTSLPRLDLQAYVAQLIHHHLPDRYVIAFDGVTMDPSFGFALERVEHCFSRIHRRYYNQNGSLLFDHLHADHMATLLYFLGNTVWKETKNGELAARLSYLNKILHGLDLFYSVSMPDIFLLVHPVGTVIGNAQYQDYLVVYQNCTIGAVGDRYPKFGNGNIMYAKSTVLGASSIGDDVVIGANALVVGCDVPSSHIVVGQYPNHRMIENPQSVRSRCFDARDMPGVD